MAPTDLPTPQPKGPRQNPPGPESQASGGQAGSVKGLRPDPLRGLTDAPPPLSSRPGRGAEPRWKRPSCGGESSGRCKQLYSAELHDGRRHRPDLVLFQSRRGIEVELSQKSKWRLDSILRGWRATIGARRLEGIRYL